jgi:hypothetical protein
LGGEIVGNARPCNPNLDGFSNLGYQGCMNTKDRPAPPAKTAADPRAERLKAALKANIARRKEQARGRARSEQSQPENRPEQEE